MSPASPPGMAVRFLVIGASLVVILAGIRAAQPIVVPFLLSAFIAVLCLPPMVWMQRRGLPSVVAVTILIVGLVAVSVGFAAVVGNSLKDFTTSLPEYQDRLQDTTGQVVAWLKSHRVEMPADVLQEYVDPGAVMGLVGNTLAGIGGMLTNGVLILLTVVFILFEASSLPGKMRAAFGDATRSLEQFDAITRGLQRYIVIKTTVSVATGTLIALWLWLIGVDHPVLWGLLAFLFNYIPNIGSIIAAVPTVLLAVVQLGFLEAVLTAAGYAVANTVMGNLVEPRFMGRGLGLSTLVVFLSLVFWGWLMGPVGMLLSVPLTMMAKIVLEGSPETRWIAVLLDSEARPPPEEARS